VVNRVGSALLRHHPSRASHAVLPEGDTYVHDTTNNNPLEAHTQFILGGLNDLRAADDPRHYGGAEAGNVPMIYDQSVFTGSDNFNKDVREGRFAGLDEGAVAGYESGARSQLVDVSSAAPDWDGDGQVDWIEQAFESGRRQASEAGRWALGRGARAADAVGAELDRRLGLGAPDATGLLGNGLNLLTGGEDMGVSGTQMQRFLDVHTWAHAQLAAGMPVDAIIQVVRTQDLPQDLIDRLVGQLQDAA